MPHTWRRCGHQHQLSFNVQTERSKVKHFTCQDTKVPTLATVDCIQAPDGSQGTPMKKGVSEATKGM